VRVTEPEPPSPGTGQAATQWTAQSPAQSKTQWPAQWQAQPTAPLASRLASRLPSRFPQRTSDQANDRPLHLISQPFSRWALLRPNGTEDSSEASLA
jgi:hypothetical protein